MNTSAVPQNTVFDWIIVVQAHCLNIVIIIGLLCNVVNIIVFLNKPMRKKPFTAYHISLAFWDIVLLASAMIALIIERISNIDLPRQSSMVSYTTMNCSMNVCVVLTVAATHERYIAITHPMKRLGQNGLKRAVVAIVSISTICCLYNIPKYFELEVFEYRDEDNSTVMSMQPSWFRNVWWYLLFYRFLGGIIFGSVVPIAGVAFMGMQVLRSVRASASFQRLVRQHARNHVLEAGCMASGLARLDQQETSLALLQPTDGNPNQLKEYVRIPVPPRNPVTKTPVAQHGSGISIVPGSKQEQDVIRMIFTHGVKFVSAYLLPTVIDTAELWIGTIGDGVIPRWFKYLVVAGNFLVVSNSCSNILLYLCFCSAYRRSAVQVWSRFKN